MVWFGYNASNMLAFLWFLIHNVERYNYIQ